MKETDHVATALKTLESKVSEIQDSDTFRQYLDYQARFHQYSFNNVLLIMAQYPEASRVAGYRSWQQMNRFVRKGEKSIRILAPMKRKFTDEETGEDGYRVSGFRAVSVFAQEQTEGEDLPTIPVPVLDSEAGGELYGRMNDLAGSEGLSVSRTDPMLDLRPSVMGFLDRPTKRIVVRDGVSQLQATKTLAHEIGHFYANHEQSGPATETEAEGVAYVVLRRFGLDSGERSFPYISTWAQDKNVLRAALGQIQRVSGIMIDKLTGEEARKEADF
jgi:hypothetical protein